VDDLEPGNALRQGQRADLPVQRVTVNSIVALNLAYFRKAAGLTQEELGERIGWGKSVVSTAERSWDAKRVRSFSAEDLIGIAAALQVPLAALFLAPEDDGTAFRYVLDTPGSEEREVADLLTYVFPAFQGDSRVMNAYRKRVIAAGASRRAADLFDPTGHEIDDIIERARREPGELLRDAGGDSELPLEEAIRTAEQITADARARAAALVRDAQELVRQALGRVDDLRAFERDYRTRLQAFVEGQLLELYTPETRPRAERMIEEVCKRAAEGGVLGVTALILREDGTYGMLQYPPGSQDRAGAEQAPASGEDGD
jgi:transcriptional regulator with XRE-family HTH domain